MADILDEVQEELREQKAVNNLKFFAKIAGIAMVASVVVVMSWSKYQESSQMAIVLDGERYNKAFISMVSSRHAPENSLHDFQQVFEKSENVYGVLAGFQIAKISLMVKDFDKASTVLHKIANSKYATDEYKDYASLMALVVDHDSNKIATKEFVSKLEIFAKKETFLKPASEEFIVSELLSTGEIKQAKDYLTALRDYEGLQSNQATRVAGLDRLADAKQ